MLTAELLARTEHEINATIFEKIDFFVIFLLPCFIHQQQKGVRIA